MELELKANKLNCNASSCSDLKIKGIAERFIANASSGSDINARNLTTVIIDTISSTGADMVVNVLKELTAKVESGDDVTYLVNPEKVNKSGGVSNSVK